MELTTTTAVLVDAQDAVKLLFAAKDTVYDPLLV
jgi:hypothetical protein